ncbi:MAG: beta-hydroxyacyl-ACP dehydratase [Bacteroidia bacterium]|nr:beta-hydroxyacyl-ACP dehydratase [Bacteroidia bacterium]
MNSPKLLSDSQLKTILEVIPQTFPFRFIDELLELDEHHAKGVYRFKNDEYFYQGHFKNNPITPGVILTETMAQIGLISLGIYLESLKTSLEEVKKKAILFTRAEVEFVKVVLPGDRVIVEGKLIHFRLGNIKSNVEMRNENGELLCSGILTGQCVKA